MTEADTATVAHGDTSVPRLDTGGMPEPVVQLATEVRRAAVDLAEVTGVPETMTGAT